MRRGTRYLYETYPGSGIYQTTRPVAWSPVRPAPLTAEQNIVKGLFDDGVLTDALDAGTYTQTESRTGTATGFDGETLAEDVIARRLVTVYPGKQINEVFIGAAATHDNANIDQLQSAVVLGDDQAVTFRVAPKGYALTAGGNYPSCAFSASATYPWFLFNKSGGNMWQGNMSGTSTPTYADTPAADTHHVIGWEWSSGDDEALIRVGGTAGTAASGSTGASSGLHIGRHTTDGREINGTVICLHWTRHPTTAEATALATVLGHGDAADFGSL